ncbi:MAG: class I SAM-dependent methyltransferase [Bacteroidota bacterium]|nr:class I SAM-dependent methyltransferase [Bacteroidota bacterium]
MTTPCLLCGNTENNQLFKVKELQLGLDEYFNYQLCGHCGSMQLQDVPADLGRYYPNEDYYSFKLDLNIREKADTLRKIKADYLLFGKNKVLGSLLSIGYKLPEQFQWMKDLGARYDDSILDIGTGNGSLLARLFQIGFTNLTGIDPFINESHDYGSIRILKKNIYEVNEQYDIVMMHHSLEHMFEPQKVMAQAMKITKPGGAVMVRIPIMGNYGWQIYGVYWCGIDAPRHIFIPSARQMRQLAEDAGFIIEKFYYDSSDYLIWSSEQYKVGMPLHDPKSHMFNKDGSSMFSREDIKRFRAIMKTQNEKGNGDTAVICLRKPAV